MLKVVCYVRVSHEEQAKHGYSLDAQKDALQNWSNDNNCIILDWYIDEGVSARKKVKNRPALQRLLTDVEQGEIDMIIFIKLDRYFRSVSEYYETQKILEKHRVHWRAILEDYDTTTTDGRFKINLMLSIAEQEADRISDRIKFTFQHKIKKKQPITGSQPFGYKIGQNPDGSKCVVIDENAADNVREIFAHFLQYQSVSATTKHMVNNYDVNVEYDIIKKLLRNTYYYGHYKGVDDYCPAYIDKETFDTIQGILKNRNIKTPRTRRVYLFSGLLQCPSCGINLSGNFLRKTKKNGDYLTYRCNNNRQNKTCDFNYCLPERKFEKWLLSHIKPELEKYIATIEIDAPKAAPVGDRSEIVAEMERLNYMFQKNRIKIDDYEKQYSQLERKLEKIDAAENKPVDVSHILEFLNGDVLDLYGEISREDKRAAWRQIIDEIIIDRNGNHTVKFLR